MAITRSLTRKKSKTCESAPWSELIQDALFVIMMNLGIVDFFSFSWVCKSWRLCALTNRAHFIKSQPPLLISSKDCYLQDSQGTKFKTMVRDCIGRICYGVSCGYIILYKLKTNDFLLVNPITRHQLHFSDVPVYRNSLDPKFARGILVYSRFMSAWVFLFVYKYQKCVWYKIACEQSRWKTLDSNLRIVDLYSFKGKIYTLHESNILCEMRLVPEPSFSQLDIKNVPKRGFVVPKFLVSDDKLYSLYFMRGDLYETFELDFDNMKWLPAAKRLSEYAVFMSEFMCGAAIKPKLWVGPGTQYERCYTYYNSDTIIGGFYTSKFWYFPHESLHENLLQE